MSQVVELGWIPVKEDFESSPVMQNIKDLHSKVIANADLLGQWEGIQNPGGLDKSPVKGVHLAAVWTSVEAAETAKQSAEGQEMRKLWGQVIELSSPSGPVMPKMGYFNLKGDDFAKVAAANVILLTASYISADADTAAFEEKWQSFMRAHASSGAVTAGYVAGAHGWTVDDIDIEGQKKKVFMVVTGWDSEESVKEATGGDRRAKFEEALKEFNIMQHEHVCSGFKKLK